MSGPARRKPICWRSSARLCVLVASALAGARGASAQQIAEAATDCLESRECVEMVQSGRRLSESNQLNAALQTYESAYAQWHSPWLLINIGRIQQKLGRPAEAIASYHAYFERAAGDSPTRAAAARGYLQQAESDLAASRAGHLTDRPIYKRWWLWTTVGSAVAVAAITAGVVIATRSAEDSLLPANTFMFMF